MDRCAWELHRPGSAGCSHGGEGARRPRAVRRRHDGGHAPLRGPIRGLPTSRRCQSGVWRFQSGVRFLQKRAGFTYRNCARHLQYRGGAVHEGALLFKSASSHGHQDLCKQTRAGLLHIVLE
uniref:Uncharacterized protein n=1 Tax=Arundo donax TaxID=35708 RepID=A0A0A9CPR3_ARUDO